VVDTDLLARDAVAPGTAGLKAVADVFGAEILAPDGTLDRRLLRQRAFASPEARQQLDAILHPRIAAAMEVTCRDARGPYQVLVIPLLFEAGFRSRVDRALVVDCPEALQQQRLQARDGGDVVTRNAMLAAQLPRARRLLLADDILDNGGAPDWSRAQVTALHQRYLRLAGH
jgi:dephospho-CoA kinase